MSERRYQTKSKQPPEWILFGFTLSLLVAIGFFAGCAAKSQNLTPAIERLGHSGNQLPTAVPSADVASRLMPGRPPGYFPSPNEELWIITRSTRDNRQRDGDGVPGSGALMTRLPGQEKEVPLPLKHTDVKAAVSGYIATVQVAQHFHNPYDSKIEAAYVFPLPHNAAVNEFVMTIGERHIRGIIRERQEAERVYSEAKSQGYLASLLTEERPNIFTQSVANIEPGMEIDVNIKYFNTLVCADGWYEFVFPMVVGSRFNPPDTANGSGAVARGQHGFSGRKSEVQYLRSDERSGHDIALTVDVNAGVAIEETACQTHSVSKETVSPDRFVMTLDPNDRIPNRDFVLRYRVAGDRIKSSLLTYRDDRGGYFTLMLYPPQKLNQLERQALELVFVLDCSGSMSGRPLEQARAAVRRALQRLQPLDTFQLIADSNHPASPGPGPLPATPENIRRGLAYLESLKSETGRMTIDRIRAALDSPHNQQRLRFVCLLTDGCFGNETEILDEVHKRLASSRIFNFGVGSSVNHYLLDHLAKLGRGAVAYLGPKDDAAKVMDDFFKRISHPTLTDLGIDWGGMQATEVFPDRPPDLFAGRPVILTGRFTGDADANVRIVGNASGQAVELAVPANLADTASHKGLPTLWARTKIADLADRMTYESNTELPQQIKQTALDYGLLSPFTVFVTVDSTRRTEGKEGKTVPVPVPGGVNYETTVGEK